MSSQRLSRSLSLACNQGHLLFANWDGNTFHFYTLSPSPMAPPLLSNRDTCMGLWNPIGCHLAWPYSAHIHLFCKTPPINSNGLTCNNERNPPRLSRSLSLGCNKGHLLFANWGGDTIHFCTLSPSPMAPPLLSNRDTSLGCHLACKSDTFHFCTCMHICNPLGCHLACKSDTSHACKHQQPLHEIFLPINTYHIIHLSHPHKSHSLLRNLS